MCVWISLVGVVSLLAAGCGYQFAGRAVDAPGARVDATIDSVVAEPGLPLATHRALDRALSRYGLRAATTDRDASRGASGRVLELVVVEAVAPPIGVVHTDVSEDVPGGGEETVASTHYEARVTIEWRLLEGGVEIASGGETGRAPLQELLLSTYTEQARRRALERAVSSACDRIVDRVVVRLSADSGDSERDTNTEQSGN